MSKVGVYRWVGNSNPGDGTQQILFRSHIQGQVVVTVDLGGSVVLDNANLVSLTALGFVFVPV